MTRILLVEDEKNIIISIKMFLEKQGYIVEVANNGIEALEKVQTTLPDLILLDIVMPKMNGLTVCRIMKENPETKHIPIVFISAKTQKADIDEALKLGAEEYIIKPFNHEEIKSVIKKYI